MKLTKHLSLVILSLSLCTLLIPGLAVVTVSAQATTLNIALQRGYRTGYSDGYMAGYRDIIDGTSKDVIRHQEYAKADRAFNRDYGTIEDYRDGYQQGFESGYDTGYEKSSFESTLPSDLKTRGVIAVAAQTSNAPAQPDTSGMITIAQPVSLDAITPTAAAATNTAAPTYSPEGIPVIVIPQETELLLEIQEDLSTERNREGDKFTAKVVSPSELAGGTIEGRISKIIKPGRLKRRSEMLLSFDRIIISGQRWSNFNAQLTEVLPVKGDNIKTVDTEGTAVGRSSYKSDAVRVGGATGTGLVIGAIAGGPVGAAVGASVGAAFGVGAVVIERGKHVNLNRNQQLRVKTAYETQIR